METVLMKTMRKKQRTITREKGTETDGNRIDENGYLQIEKHSSPTGDGNSAAAVTIHAVN